MASPLLNTIDGVFLHVRDLRRAAEWYSAVFDLPLKEHELERNYYTLNMPGTRPWITLDDHAADPAYVFQPSLQPACNFLATDLAAARAHLLALGAAWAGEITAVHAGLASFLFRDPDGNMLMVVQRS